jgi:hypothetical protein
MTLIDSITDIVAIVMPINATVKRAEDVRKVAAHYSISWPITDAAGIQKSSKVITIRITLNAEMLFDKFDDAARKSAEERLSALIKNKLSNFDPTHGNPAHHHPPLEQWNVPDTIILGGP